MKISLPYGRNKSVILRDQEIFLLVAIILLVMGGLIYGANRLVKLYSNDTSKDSVEISYVDQSNNVPDDYNIVNLEDVADSNLDLPERRVIDPSTNANNTRQRYNTDNSEECQKIANQQKVEIDALNSQIVEQLRIMKVIIGNSSLDSAIYGYGGTTTGLLNQSQINSTFDQANNRANALIEELGIVKRSYRDKYLALDNGNSPSCSAIMRAQLGG